MGPGCATVTVKLLVILLLVTSLSYLASSSYSISELVKSDEHTTTHYKVHVSCLAVTMAALVVQAIVCLNLVFKSSADIDCFRSSIRTWGCVQTVLLVVVVLGFLVPFSVDMKGNAESFHGFFDRTSTHFGEFAHHVRETNVEHSEHINTALAVVHLVVGVMSVVMVLIAGEVWLKNAGYSGIR